MLLYFFVVGAHVGEDSLDAELIDGLDSLRRHMQLHLAVFARDLKTMPLQVRIEAAFCFIVGVRDIVTEHRFLAGHLTFLGHIMIYTPQKIYDCEARDYITSPGFKARGRALDSPAREIV